MQTGNFKFIRNLNEQIVLNLIRKYNIISSSELVNRTGMRPSTIFNILKDLSTKSLVINVGKGESTEKGGKKPYLWKLNSSAAFVVGLDIEITKISAVILNLEGEILAKNSTDHSKIENAEELVCLIEKSVNSILEISELTLDKILGIGIALPAICDNTNGILIRNDVFSGENIPLVEMVNKIFNIPVLIENNANATAVGAKWAGAAKGRKNFLVALIEFDRGVGGFGLGIMIDEHIYRGYSHCAGEVNMPIMNLDQMMIFFRHEIKDSEILNEYDDKPDELDLDTLISAALSGDTVSLNLFNRLGYQLGKIISPFVALLNPDALVIAGTISDLGGIITNPIKEVILKETIPFIGEKLRIRTSLHGAYSVAVGGACLILSEFFNIPIVKRGFSSEGQSLLEITNGNH